MNRLVVQPRPLCLHRPGFSLAEMTVSLAVIALLMTTIGSVMVLATKALPGRIDPLTDQLDVDEALQRLCDDLRYAQYLTESGSAAVTVTVADRDGDGRAERIRYAWAGTSGDPLTRQYNSRSPQIILEHVQQFALTYQTVDTVKTYPGPVVASAEQLFSSYSSSSDRKDYKVDKDHWAAQPFIPALPADAVGWRPTRVRFRAKSDGSATEQLLIQWRLADSQGLPTSSIIDEQVLNESDMTSSYRNYDIAATTDQWQDVTATGCIVFAQPATGGACGKLRRYDNATGLSYTKTGDAGASWQSENDKALWHEIYGQYATAGPTQQITRQSFTAVDIALTAGQSDAPATRADHVRLTNRPERLSAAWKLDFDTDPTTVDVFGDGQDDWTRRDGQPFNPASLSGGLWYADATLDTHPANDFTQPTTIDVRMRNTSVGGYGAVLWVNADYAAGSFAPIWVSLQLQPDNSQTLTLYRKSSDSQDIVLARVTDLDSGFVEVRLLIDPAADTVNLRINDAEFGTYPYSTYSPGASELNRKFVSLVPSGSSAEFDAITIRVGGNW